jgi:hypothetical protein
MIPRGHKTFIKKFVHFYAPQTLLGQGIPKIMGPRLLAWGACCFRNEPALGCYPTLYGYEIWNVVVQRNNGLLQ